MSSLGPFMPTVLQLPSCILKCDFGKAGCCKASSGSETNWRTLVSRASRLNKKDQDSNRANLSLWRFSCKRARARGLHPAPAQNGGQSWKGVTFSQNVVNKSDTPNDECVLAVDIGTGGTKVAIISRYGEVLGTGFHQHLTTVTSSRGLSVVEQDPEEWWLATLTAAERCFSQLDGRVEATIRAMAVTGQMQDLILLPAGVGVKLPPAILYSDTRAAFEAEEITKLGGGRERVASITGTEQGASSLLAKLRWLDRHKQGAIQQCSNVLFGAHDYVVYKLCGRCCTDTTTASTTGLTLCDSPDAYAEELMGEIGLSGWLAKLPSMVAHDLPCGQISEAAAAAMGRLHLKGIPVFHSCGDAGATTIGCGAGSPGPMYAYLGTSGWIGASMTRQDKVGQVARSASASSASPQGVFTLAHPNPALVFRTGSIMTAGGNLKWALSLLSEDAATSMMTPQDADELAAGVSAGAGGLLYLPYLNGERCPFDDGNARGAFVGLSSSTTKGAMLRAVMEGVAFALKDAEVAMTSSYSGADSGIADRLNRLRMVGGGARSSLWPTILAGIFDRPIDVLADMQCVGAGVEDVDNKRPRRVEIEDE